MELRDVVATALAAAGVTGTATASACLTGKAWVGVLVASVLVLAAAVLLLISPPEEVVVPADTVSEPPQRTMRTTAPSLGIEVEESRQGTMPKIGHAIGQDPAFYEALDLSDADPERLARAVKRFKRGKARTS